MPAPASPSPRPWRGIDVPPSILELPRMLYEDERRYLTWLTKSQYQGWGAIVDLGCWLGCSTVCMAEGLRQSGKQGKVAAFDLFEWDPGYMAQDAPGVQLPYGGDFMPEFHRLTAPWKDRIAAEKVDLFGYRWERGPIEILFVDAAKSWGLLNHILRGFADAIVPGKTRIVFQDYRLPMCLWVPLVTMTRPDLWQEIENTTNGTTATFLARRPLFGEGGIGGDYWPESFDFATADRVLRERLRTDPDGKTPYSETLVRVARMYGSEADVVRARAVVDGCDFSQQYRLPADRLEEVAGDLVPAAWRACERRDYEAAMRFARRSTEGPAPSPWAHGPLGMALLATGKLAEAEREFLRMHQALPDCRQPLVYLADVQSQQGRDREALSMLARVLPTLDADPSDAGYAFALLRRIGERTELRREAATLALSASVKVRSLPSVGKDFEFLARLVG